MSRVRQTLVLAVVALATAASTASGASPYTVYTCTQPDGAAAGIAGLKLGGQQIADSITPANFFGDQCGRVTARPSRRALIVSFDGGDGVERKADARLDAPTGTYIQRGRLHWGGYMAARTTAGTMPFATATSFASVTDVNGAVAPLSARRELMAGNGEQKNLSWGDWDQFTNQFSADRDVAIESYGVGTYRSLHLGGDCIASAPPAVCSLRLAIHRLETVFVDTEAPRGRVTGLATPGAVVTGTLSAEIDASDVGSGVRELQIRAGDIIATRRTIDAPASCAGLPTGGYTSPTPCPHTATASLELDTTTLAEGPTTLRAVVLDAAGNETVLGDPIAVTVDNLDPYSEDVLAANDLQCGTDATGRWFNPAYVAGGEANGAPSTGDATVTGSFPTTRSVIKRGKKTNAIRYARTRTVHYESSPTVTGRLVAASGEAIRGARVFLAQRRTGGRWSLCAAPHAETNATGSYRLKAPTRGTDREVMAVYFPQGDANTVVTGRVLQLRVRTGVRLTRPPRAVRNGTRVRFRGRIKGERLAGTLVTLQVRVGRRGWRDFATVRARPDGTYAKRWRFRNSKGAKYRFRAVVKPQAGRPYATGYSASHPIVVR